MIPLKGRNAPKSRDKPEDPKCILEAVAEADRLRTLELVCVEHQWKVVHVDMKEHCLDYRCQVGDSSQVCLKLQRERLAPARVGWRGQERKETRWIESERRS